MKKLSRFWQLFPVTLSVAGICVLVYLAMLYSGAHFANPHNQALIAWGGNYRPMTITGQSWRLLTALFVHGGWLHLLLNMVALVDIGHLLEQKIGRRMMLVIFLLSGLFGGLCSLIWHPMTVGVGASGAIMGLAGALLVWLALPKLERAAEIERTVQVRALALGLTLTLGVGAFLQRIDNAAHVGGLLAGLLLGLIVYALDRLRPGAIKRWLAALLLLIAGLLLIWQQLRAQSADEYKFRKPLPSILAIFQRYSNVSTYLHRRAERENADAGIVAENAGGNSKKTDRVWLDQSFAQALQGWENCRYLSQSWQGLRLQEPQKTLASHVIAYCSVRQQQYQLLRNNLRQGRDTTQAEIEPLVSQAKKLERKMLPLLFIEIEIAENIADQMGMTMSGKRKALPPQ